MILVFGQTGQVAQEIARLSQDVVLLGRAVCDVAEAGAARAAILEQRPTFVVNAAAYTAVDKAETEPDLAAKINSAAPGEMAAACAEL